MCFASCLLKKGKERVQETHFNQSNLRVEPEKFVKLNVNMPPIRADVLLGGPHVRRSADVRTIPFRTCVIRRRLKDLNAYQLG